MRRVMIGFAALFLSGCGNEVYPVPATEAYLSLSSIGTPSGMSPLPGGLEPVSVNFESIPGENKVQWLFTHAGDDIGRIVAVVTPDGDASSNVAVRYVDGTAPDEKWRNGQARRLIEYEIQKLVVEAVDSKLENRAFDEGLRKQVTMNVATASISSMMSDVSASMDAHIAKQKEREQERKNRTSTSPYAATKPATDLSKYN